MATTALRASSLLEMEIGGTNVTAYDRIVVGGNLSITGALAIVPINSFSPRKSEIRRYDRHSQRQAGLFEEFGI